jgi:DNA-binding response OmpR family regulator
VQRNFSDDEYELISGLADMGGIAIIFLSTKGRKVDIARGLALGAEANITKPFSNTELVARIKELSENTHEEAVK